MVISAGLYLFSRLRIPSVKLLVIPEGYTVVQIDELLAKNGVLEAHALINFDIDRVRNDYWFLEGAKNLEGFLFPDTYEFFLNSAPEAVVRKFLDNFKKKAGPSLPGDGEKAMEIIIMASIIEKEVPDFNDDRPLVSGLLWKRLRNDMPLQVDAAICFIKNPAGCRDISPVDLKIDSPYNTYLYRGLPPGPISNPGLSAISAALHPKGSPFWYYISHPQTKKTIFAETLDEHQQNIVKYLK